MPGDQGDDQNPVQHVSIKAPAFMETAANGWFSIMEAQFHLCKVTVDQTKYYHVISALPPEIVAKLPSSIHENKQYEELKNAVINSYESTKPELFEKLISKTTMSGRPSVYLQELASTAAKIGVGDDIVRHKFIQASPATISPVLAAQKSLTLQQLGTLADELMPYFQDKVMHVNKQPQRYNNTYQEHQTNRNQSQLARGLRPFSENQRPKICRTHLYFAEKARNCTAWCKWPNKSNCTIQASSRSASPAPDQKN